MFGGTCESHLWYYRVGCPVAQGKQLPLRTEDDLRALFIAHIADIGASSRLFNLALDD